MKYSSKMLLLLLGVLSLAACSKKAVYIDESFANDSPFKLRVESDVGQACESARRSLLGQGYLIDLANNDEVKARKATRGENAFIEMNVVCVPERSGTTIFATGVVSTYDLKKNSSSASVGLSALGSISLPIGQSVDSLVKVSEETIDDKDFYKRFFAAVDLVLGSMDTGETPIVPEAELVVEPAVLEPAPPVQSAIWPELFPEQVAPGVVPDPLPAHTESGSLPAAEPTPVPAAPEMPAEPVLKEPPSEVPASAIPIPDEEPLGIFPAPMPAAEPLGIPAVPVPQDDAQGTPSPSISAEPAPSANTPVLAPIHTVAVKKAVVESATAAQKTPEAAPANTPAAEIENLF